MCGLFQSGKPDLNRRPQVPQTCTLNPCAIARNTPSTIAHRRNSVKRLYVYIDNHIPMIVLNILLDIYLRNAIKRRKFNHMGFFFRRKGQNGLA